MTRYELTFTCRSCGEEVEPIEHGDSFLLPSGLHDCIDREDSTVARTTSTGLSLLAEDALSVDIEAHSIYPPGYEEHTLQWAENDAGEITTIHITPDPETSAAAKMGRAQIKTVGGECREVAGSKEVIEQLRNKLGEFLVDDINEKEP